MIDIRQLSYFVAVVEAKSFTAAAEVLCIAQPALSQHLQRLEHDFGHQLLVRHSKGITPTAAGLRLVEHARAILTRVDDTRDDIRRFDLEPRGRVSLGLPPSLCEAIATELLKAWPHDHPNVSLQIVEQPSNALTKSVQAGRLDLAVTAYPSDTIQSLTAETLMRDRLCAVLPRTEASQPLREIDFANLAGERLILHSQDNVTRQLIDMTAKYASVQLHVVYEIDSSLLALQMVEAGMGATIQPYLAVCRYLQSGRAAVCPINGPSITRRLHLIRSRQQRLNTYERKVYTALKTHLLRELAGHDPWATLEVFAEA